MRDIIRSVASWVVLFALAIDALVIALEPATLLLRGSPVRAALAAMLAGIGLSVAFAIVAAVPAAMTHGAIAFLARRKAPWRFLWPLPLAAVGWVAVVEIATHRVIHAISALEGEEILAVLFVGALVTAVLVARVARTWLRLALGVGLTLLTVAVDSRLPGVVTTEPRDLLWLCTVFFFAAAFHPLRAELAARSHEQVSRAFGLVVAGSLPLLFLAPLVAPDWRTYASNGARFAPRIARFARVLVDFDDDGFSAIAWGTDCDDESAARHPAFRELLDGIDHNCNGKLRPAAPTDAQRGLAPPAGEPDARSGEIERVLLVTIDCFRNDAFNPEVTPNLVRFADRGLRFAKLYASGARTSMSLPFALRGAIDAPTVAEILGSEKVSSTAIFGYRHSTLEENVFAGFDVLKRPDQVDHRIRAGELTTLALADFAPARAPHFLWAHYFDAHGPRSKKSLPPDARTFPPMPFAAAEATADSALYLAELHWIDAEVGRLIDGVIQNGGLDHTVVIVTSDHGEGFGQHGVFEHGVSAFEEIVHVPGFLLAPGLTPGVYPHVVSQRDIAATILGAFGLVAKHPAIETFGRSWLRLRAAPDAPLHDFAFTYETTVPFEHWGDAPMASIATDRAKLSVSNVDGITRLYDLGRDPGEEHELAQERPSDVTRYRDELEVFRDVDTPPP